MDWLSPKIWPYLALMATVAAAWLLQDILMPFVLGAFFAYLTDPLVNRLQGKRIGRSLAVSIIFAGMALVGLLICIAVLPVLFRQFGSFIQNIPHYVDVMQGRLLPLLQQQGISLDRIPLDELRAIIQTHWQKAGNVAAVVLKQATSSTLSAIGIAANLLLVPVVSFYLLRDWGKLMQFLRDMLPRSLEKNTMALLAECDEVLSAFIRGQLLVMTSLGTIYSVGLGIVGLDLALLLGTLAGFASVVPYLGAIVGILSAGLMAWLQFHEWLPLVYVLIVFGVGQLLEGMLLTPMLVGDKIGLHPVAVIFAIMAGGQLAGFTGILLALPVAAVLMVFVRRWHHQYKASDLYLNTDHE